MDRFLLKASYRFPIAFSVDDTMLGLELPVDLMDITAIVKTPVVEWTDDCRPLIVTPLRKYSGASASGLTGIDEWEWGAVYHHDPQVREVLAASLNGVIFEFPDVSEKLINHAASETGRGQPEGVFVQELQGKISAWGKMLLLWIDVLTGQDLDFDAPIRDLSTHGEGTRIWSECAGKISRPAQPSRFTLTRRTIEIVSLEMFRWVTRKIVADIVPSIEQQLLVDARRAANRRQTRRAIIDAATAAELALNELLKRELNCLKPKLRDRISNQNRTLGPLVDMAMSAGVSLPDDTKIVLVTPRNDAMHRGESPGLEQTRAAIRIAESIVRLVDPLSFRRSTSS